MEYFKVVSLGLGGYTAVMIVLHFIFSEKYSQRLIEIFLPEKKPVWIFPLAIIMTLWVLYSWYQFFGFIHAVSFIVSLYLTLGFFKMFFFILQYEKMRDLSIALITREKVALNIILLSSLALAIGMVYLGLKI